MKHHELAELCASSYEDMPDYSKNGVDVFRTVNDRNMVFVIRGTQPKLIDIVRNLAWWPRSLGKIDAHAGFADGWQGVQDFIDDHIKEWGDRRTVILTGHSQGGAIALIGAVEMTRKKQPLAECVTFGAPRTISVPDIWSLNFLVTQYIHARDPIPSWLGATDYQHVRKQYIGGEESSAWWRKSLDAHGINLYAEILKRARI